jgi:hypothetical protein
MPVRAEPGAGYILETIRAGGSVEQSVTVYINGLENGYGWANATLSNNGEVPLYCQPSRLALSQDQIVDILRRFVEANPNLREMQTGLVLLMALQEMFPC